MLHSASIPCKLQCPLLLTIHRKSAKNFMNNISVKQFPYYQYVSNGINGNVVDPGTIVPVDNCKSLVGELAVGLLNSR